MASIGSIEPLICAVSTYAAIFGLAHVAKWGIDKSFKKASLVHTFLFEAVTALQMCTCVYENGIIIGNYGLPGFFIAVSLLLTTAGFTNRGYFGNPLGHLEKLFKGHLGLVEFIVIISGQFIGSAGALKAASAIWYYTSALSASHLRATNANLCGFTIHYPLNYVMIIEAIYCGALRFAIGQFTQTTWRRKYAIPVLVAAFLSASIYFVGVAGLNPMTAYARMAMCEGLDNIYFFYTYWLAAAAGWMFGAHIQEGFNAWWTGRLKAKKAASQDKQREAAKEKKKVEKKVEKKARKQD